MGKSASEIDQELDQTRSDAAEKIEKIEQQISQSAESVKQSLDWRYQVQERPLLAVGTAFLGGLILGELTNSDDNDSGRRQHASAPGYWQDGRDTPNHHGIMGGTLRQITQTSGIDDALSSAAAAMLGSAGQRIKDAVEETYPGFVERYERSTKTDGDMAHRTRAAARAEQPDGGAGVVA